jgi:fumarate reductase subunit D
MRRRPAEPLLWMLFSAGGVVTALLLPALALLFAVAFPLGLLAPPGHAELLALIAHPVVRVGLFFVFTLSLFHWAHRFRYTLYDGLQVKHLNDVINLVCYGGAVVGSIWAAAVLWGVG